MSPPGGRPVAVVTGGSRGIGAAVAATLARRGYDLVTAYRRDATAADEVADDVAAAGGRCVPVQASLDTVDGVRAVVSAAERLGRVDALVHAAGVVSSGRDVADTDDAEVELALSVHLLAPFRLTRDLLPMLRTRRGSVVLVSSSVTRHMRAGGAPYNLGKAAAEALARTLAAEERPRGVRVNIVSPGLVDTELGRRFVRAAHGRDLADLAPLLPFGRVCSPSEVADVVAWLCSDRSSYVTGENIAVNGGDDTASSDVVGTRAALAALRSTTPSEEAHT